MTALFCVVVALVCLGFFFPFGLAMLLHALFTVAPAALLIWALVYVLLAGLRFFRRFRDPAGPGLLVALCLGLLVLMTPPMVERAKISMRVSEVRASDRNELTLPLSADVVAIRVILQNSEDIGPFCDLGCQLLLLSGEAKEVLVTAATRFDDPLSDAGAVTGFRLVEGANCPPLGRMLDPGWLYGSNGPRKPRSVSAAGRHATESLLYETAHGRCLVAREADLGQADLVLSRGMLSPAEATGERDDPVGFEIYRFNVHRRISEGGFRKIYQGSDIGYRPMIWLYLPDLSKHKGRRDLAWRKEARAQIDFPPGNTISWPAVLERLFEIDLVREDPDRHARAVELFERISFEARGPSPSEWAYLREYLGHYSGWGSREQHLLAVRILRDPRFPSPKIVREAVDAVLRSGNLVEQERLAAVMVARLEDLVAAEAAGMTLSQEEQWAGTMLFAELRELPEVYLLPRRARIAAVATSEVTPRWASDYAETLMQNTEVYFRGE